MIQQKTQECAAQSSSFSKDFSAFYYFQVVLNKVLKLLSKTAELIVSDTSVSTFLVLGIVPDGHGSLLTSTVSNETQQSSGLTVIFRWADPVSLTVITIKLTLKN